MDGNDDARLDGESGGGDDEKCRDDGGEKGEGRLSYCRSGS